MTSTSTVRLLVCAITVATSVLLGGCGGARARFASHLQRGQEFLASGNLDKASVEFRNAAQIEPKNAEALYFNGRVAEARGNIREAYGLYQAALEVDAAYDPARAGSGKMLVFAGDAKRAQEIIAPGLAAHPDNADLLAVRAAAHQQLKEREQARADAERAVQLAPMNENALAVLAALYADAKEYSQAVSLVNAAIGRAPASIELREVLTNLYLVSGQSEKADEQMRKIIELKPAELRPRSQLALHLARAHDLQGAQRVLEEAVKALSNGKQPEKANEARLLLVDFISRERSREQGEKTLREFIAHEPENLELRVGLGALLQRTGAVDAALAAYADVVKLDGTGAKGLLARDRMADIQLDQGHADVARNLLAEVLQKNPRDDDALVVRARLEMQQNDPTAAIADLRAVLRDQPNSVPLLRTLAAAYLAKGQTGLAEEALRAAMQAAPNDVPVRVELAQVLGRTDRMSQGVSLLEQTVQRLPDDALARLELVRAYTAVGNLQGARAAAEELRTRLPMSAELLNLLGQFYFEWKDFKAAADLLALAAAQDPRQWLPHRNLARVKLAVNDPNGAVVEYQEALKRGPAEPLLVEEAVKCYEKQGRIDDAIGAYEALYEANHQVQQFAANNLAMLLVTYKRDAASLDRARDLTSGFTTSDNGTLLDTAGWVRFKRGEYQDALPALERAVEHAPDSKVIRFHLGMAQLQLGLRERARSNLESALAGPDSFQGVDEARTALASLKARA